MSTTSARRPAPTAIIESRERYFQGWLYNLIQRNRVRISHYADLCPVLFGSFFAVFPFIALSSAVSGRRFSKRQMASFGSPSVVRERQPIWNRLEESAPRFALYVSCLVRYWIRRDQGHAMSLAACNLLLDRGVPDIHRISHADGLCAPDRHNLAQGLGCRGHNSLYFCLRTSQDAHIDRSLDLVSKLLYEFSDVLRYAFYVHRFSYSRRSLLWHEWPPLGLSRKQYNKVGSRARSTFQDSVPEHLIESKTPSAAEYRSLFSFANP